ncbi:hypothetical protein DPMN_094678 [Dreissena polymorpha]|uniref:Uncharacterized protein n=1 Tax=Dreissena polymorpha TaxID=45954 RepID=A0A9D4R258_DREPO|nr:hypothetical protein DPMN_094678 [Dreissena polymorpha]
MLSIGAEGKGYISTLKIYDMSLHTVRDVVERCYDAFMASSNGELENATCSHGYVTELLSTTTTAHHTFRSTATTKSLPSCPTNQDFTGTLWPSADAGELKQMICTDKYTGTVTRKCNAVGVYENPVYNCTKIELQRLLDKVVNDGITRESVAGTIESLKTEITVDANKTLHVGDIEVATKIMEMIVVADINSPAVTNVTDAFFDVVDNLISNKTTNSWDALKDQGGAARVLYVLDDFIAKVANSNLTEAKNMTFVKNNLYIKIDTANDYWAKQSKDNIEVECRDGGNLQYSGSLFRNLSAIMTGRTEDKRTTKQINGPVLSFKKLATNQMNDLKTESVKIVFQIFNSSLDYPICSYWKKDEHGSNGQWLGDGCWLEDFNRSSGLVTCACSHLTNFAVLMSPSVTVSKVTELLSTTTTAHHTFRSTATTKSLLSCPTNQDFTGFLWPSADAGEMKQFNCTDKYTGNVTRKCNAVGVYENPVYKCTKIELQRLLDTVENDGITSESVAETIKSLNSEITVDANKTLHVGDIEVATEIMEMIVEADINSTAVKNVTDAFFDVVDTLISNKTTNSWDALKDKGGAARVLYVLDDFIAKVASSNLTEVKNMTFVKNNLYIKIDTVIDCQTVSFPGDENRGNGPDWAKQSKDNIEVECRDGGSLQYSGSLFRNLSAIMTGRTDDKRTTTEINGPVLSFKKLGTNKIQDFEKETVKIVFQIFNRTLDDPICSYWKKDEIGSNGQWLDDGCWLEDFNRSSGIVTCACSHLTNFAVLMSPLVTVSKIHHQALSAITAVGCTLSMTGLLATAIAYLYFWRPVHSH